MNFAMTKNTTFRAAFVITIFLVFLTSVVVFAQDETEDEQVLLGAELYAENCAVCHGAEGEGRVGATLNQDWPSIRPDLAMRSVITQGVDGSPMPAFGMEFGGPLNETEIDALVAYISTWDSGDVFVFPIDTPTPSSGLTPIVDVEGDPVNGAYLYASNCDVCHGDQGQGRIGAVLAQDWPSIRPDLAIKETISDGVDGSPMPAWSMASGGPLTDSEINDIVAYILSWENTDVSVNPTQSPPVPDRPASWLAGWGGILVFIVLFGLIIGIIMYFQMRSQETS
jgi:mono/diheme cytochrome c family protein